MSRGSILFAGALSTCLLLTVAVAQTDQRGGRTTGPVTAGQADAGRASGPFRLERVERDIKLSDGTQGRVQEAIVRSYPALAARLLDRWKQSEDEAERAEIERELRQLLDDEFDGRWTENEDEVGQLSERVRQLSAQLELRRQRQDEIVEFRLQQLLREAQGLGWGNGARDPVDDYGGVGRGMGLVRMMMPATDGMSGAGPESVRAPSQVVRRYVDLVAPLYGGDGRGAATAIARGGTITQSVSEIVLEIEKWKQVEGAEERKEIEENLRKLLVQQLAARLDTQQEEVEHLEHRVGQLRDQLELRREKKDEIVEFRLQQLLREAQGLGWGDGPREMRGRRIMELGAPSDSSSLNLNYYFMPDGIGGVAPAFQSERDAPARLFRPPTADAPPRPSPRTIPAVPPRR